jgi:hypothetical protein
MCNDKASDLFTKGSSIFIGFGKFPYCIVPYETWRANCFKRETRSICIDFGLIKRVDGELVMIKRTLVAAALALALASGGAQASNIVDTGTPGGWGLTFDKTQYFAGEFSLLDDSIINGIQGYFGTAAGNVGISVLSNLGDLPGSVLYSANLATTAGSAAWRGVSGLDWSLAAGAYWVAFTPDFTSAYNEITMGAPTPLLAYAQHRDFGDWESPIDNLSLGVRIDAVAAAAADVPEPTSIALCALGLAGLVVARRRTKA